MIAPMASGGARQFLRARAGVLILQACLLSGCATSQTIPNLFDTQARIERYVSSGEYHAAFAAVVEQARTYMERRASQVTKPAIVLDIDETSFPTGRPLSVFGCARIAKGPCIQGAPLWPSCVAAMAPSKAPGASLGARKARRLPGSSPPVAVVFVTGRPASPRDKTDRNLRSDGHQSTGPA